MLRKAACCQNDVRHPRAYLSKLHDAAPAPLPLLLLLPRLVSSCLALSFLISHLLLALRTGLDPELRMDENLVEAMYHQQLDSNDQLSADKHDKPNPAARYTRAATVTERRLTIQSAETSYETCSDVRPARSCSRTSTTCCGGSATTSHATRRQSPRS